jgi:hypothetical protein
MENLDTQATVGTKHREQSQIKQQKQHTKLKR